MKQTVFTRFHEELGAKMVPFAGFLMPVEYQGINAEHIQVRTSAGVFDVSHMGEIWVKGPNALPFIQYVTSNDASLLQDGKVQYTCFPNGRGGIVDDLLVYRVDEQTYLLVVNAANTAKDWEHLCSHAPRFGITPGKELYDASSEICQLAVQGPNAMKIVQKICDAPVMDMEYYTFRKCTVAGIPQAILSITGYTGAGGCEIYVANRDGEQLWKALFEAGKEFGLMAAGLGARDTLRLEMGFCLYGNDIDDTTSPLEAGLGWITKFTEAKGDFIDRAFLQEQKSRGVSRKLVGFKMIDKGIPRHEYSVCAADGKEIGRVTSGTMSPMLKIGIGMAYVETAYAGLETELYIKIRDRLLKAEVVRPPFYKKQ
ncbi:MAG TPA: glycine cleavage system aminomethyltransferase GcvT [Bacteroidales bacterium]|jgi:aminomethyltransferase|nr:glycine cleavage system aminomethyltransferase GcvT [Bacteroidales bacterium]MCZ2417620.1 glycine cleavage system aminomethyltransferase GcvT [Burkholderiales bacterium]OQC58567.1 MAG: Aminomethyltransferase [Bacteroidetes bacterium ADurb.Bin013]MBP8999371.1 glycine cleavage system aminomethyltransferase GcvT [Bacteroidales bacterium]MBV6455172.1 Aminomethyltransferase [Bacteroidales bacterium]